VSRRYRVTDAIGSREVIQSTVHTVVLWLLVPESVDILRVICKAYLLMCYVPFKPFLEVFPIFYQKIFKIRILGHKNDWQDERGGISIPVVFQ